MPEMCRVCDHNYRAGLRGLVKGNVGLYDIDIVLEKDKRILAVGEYKRYKLDYNEFLIPAFEIVAIKKVAKIMHTSCLLLVEVCNPGKSSYWYAWEVDRFETNRRFKSINGKTWAAFDPDLAVRLESKQALSVWLDELIKRLQGGNPCDV
jgi:hypothetical protein